MFDIPPKGDTIKHMYLIRLRLNESWPSAYNKTARLPPIKEEKNMGSEKRNRGKHIMIRVSESEKSAIENNAKGHSLSMADFLRKLGQGVEPKSTLDANHILELAKLNGDLGRLGGLLKIWLLDDSKSLNQEDVRKLLSEIQKLKDLIQKKVSEL